MQVFVIFLLQEKQLRSRGSYEYEMLCEVVRYK